VEGLATAEKRLFQKQKRDLSQRDSQEDRKYGDENRGDDKMLLRKIDGGHAAQSHSDRDKRQGMKEIKAVGDISKENERLGIEKMKEDREVVRGDCRNDENHGQRKDHKIVAE
jgi:hypothetical protein